MKKAVLLMIAFAFLISAAFLMSGKDAGAASFDDYNKYVYSHGMAAHFGNRCAFWDGESYTAISYEAGKAAFASPVPLECENGIYGSDNSLYYIKAGSGVPAIYKTAGGREIEVSDLDFLAGSDIGYACRIGGGFAVFEVLYADAQVPRSAVIALDLENKGAEARVPFDSASGAPLMYGGAEIRGEWLFVQAWSDASQARALYACSLVSAETRLICEERSKESVIALKDGTVYWYDPQAGFFSSPLDKPDIKMSEGFSSDGSYGFAMCDGSFFYASNCVPERYSGMASGNRARGVYVLDYSGNELAYIAVDDPGMCPAYLMADENAVYFGDADADMRPVWYIDRSELASGKASLKLIEGE